jgi:predicted nucleic acid-binding protein
VKLKVGLDSSVIIQLLAKRSSHHSRSMAACDSLVTSGAEFVLTDHALLESFSVLSRSPAPIGVAPMDAERILYEGFGKATIAPLRPGSAWDTIRSTLSHGFWGGRVYDAAIALATFEAGARLLLTWNVKHLHSVAPFGLEVREP